MDATGSTVTRISTHDLPARNRVGAFCEIYGRTILKHDIEPIGDRPFEIESALYNVPGLGLASTMITPCRAPRHRRHVSGDDLVLNIGIIGARAAQQRNRETAVGEGEAILMSGADPGIVTIPATSRITSIRVPLAVLRPKIADIEDRVLRAIPARNPALLLLIGYVSGFWRANAAATPGLRDSFVTHVHDLVALTLGAGGDPREQAQGRGLRAARLSAILRTIETRSDDPELSAVAVASHLGVTPRYVHLLLEDTGRSFSQHLMKTRLDKAAALLRDPKWRSRRVTEIALEAGFSDISYFSRAFRRHFSLTPSDIRAASAGAAAAAAADDRQRR